MHRLARLLLIEDDEHTREILADALEAHGFTVVVVTNGQEGLDTLARDGEFDAVILDMMLPIMNGWDFRTAQWHTAETARIPIVIVSAIVTLEQTARLLGAAAYFSKPIDLDRLVATLEALCTRAAGRPSTTGELLPGFTTAEPASMLRIDTGIGVVQAGAQSSPPVPGRDMAGVGEDSD